jgi:RimJ/RimL family protein N-acetyltransferase
MRIELPQRLTDGQVVLRPMRVEDAGPYANGFALDPDLGRMLGSETDPDETSVRDRIEGQARSAGDGKFVQLAIADPASDTFWGAVLLHSFDWHSRRCEVGFWVIPGQRHRGIASRAVSLAVSWVLESLDLLRVEMTTIPENLAVPALARRLGFTQEGILRSRNIERGRRVDIIWFGLLREEWPPT